MAPIGAKFHGWGTIRRTAATAIIVSARMVRKNTAFLSEIVSLICFRPPLAAINRRTQRNPVRQSPPCEQESAYEKSARRKRQCETRRFRRRDRLEAASLGRRPRPVRARQSCGRELCYQYRPQWRGIYQSGKRE